MSSDNRTIINDCEANTGWSGDDSANVNNDVGSFYQGSNSLSSQLSNADEQMSTTEDSVSTGTFSLDWSDSTLYMLIKDNQQSAFSAGGTQFVIGDGTDLTGYDIAGDDAVGLPLPSYFNAFKLDVSVVVGTPGTFTDFSGSEVNLDQTAITEIGYGTIHQAKALGASDNLWMDCFRFIANGSYALTINAGTSGTPETMTDVAGDDVTNGWGMVSNPVGDQYIFFAPTEWGESGASADHYFTADGEQWFWIGDNGGGHTVGVTHFPFRVVGNATDTGSFVISNVSVVNVGTRAELLLDSADIDILEIDGCSFTGIGAIEAPSLGGTSRFCTNTIFADCDRIDHNGADMSGCSILTSNVAADEGAIFYDETADPDGEMDNMSFSMGANNHHAIRFGTSVPASITLRGMDFVGFGSSGDSDDSVFRFDDTTGSITLNLVNCTNDGSGFTVDDAAGVNVTVVIDPVDTVVHADDNAGADLENARVYLRASSGAGPLPFQDSVTIVRASTTATVTHATHGMETGDLVKIEGITDKTEDNNGTHVITFIDAGSYSYVTTDSGSTSYTGTIISTWVALNKLTDVSGDASINKTYTGDQPVEGFVRKSSASPRFKDFQISGLIDGSTGLSINVRMVLDE